MKSMTRSGAPRAVERVGALTLLRDRRFGPFFFGKLVSSLGIWVQNITAAILMFEITGSTFMVGAVSVTQFLGPLALSLWAGALTDRLDRRKLLIVGRAVSASAATVLATIVALAGPGGPSAFSLLAGTFVLGLGLAISAPAMQAIVPALVEDRALEPALALNGVVANIARSVGPGLGAALLVWGEYSVGFAFAATAHWTFMLALFAVRPRQARQPGGTGRILDGLRYAARDRNTALFLLGVAALSFGVDPVITLTPALAEQLGGGEQMVGLLASSFGVGAVAVTLAIRPLRDLLNLRWLGVVGFGATALGLGTLGVARWVALGMVGFALAGAGFMLATTALNTRIQRRVPDDLRGRVMALWSVAFLGSRPVAAAVNGLIADWFSVAAAVFVGAALVGAAALTANRTYGSDSAKPATARG